jgi:hypothetical protein
MVRALLRHLERFLRPGDVAAGRRVFGAASLKSAPRKSMKAELRDQADSRRRTSA